MRISLCCYVHNSKINHHIGIENNAAEAVLALKPIRTGLVLLGVVG